MKLRLSISQIDLEFTQSVYMCSNKKGKLFHYQKSHYAYKMIQNLI